MKHASSSRRRQRGAALLVSLLILLLAAMSIFFGQVDGATPPAREYATRTALAQAREALIGFAASYPERHPDSHDELRQVAGFLPCPDTDNDGRAELVCGGEGVSVVGRLPWRTLDLPDLRDADYECLWYAVSGSFKNNAKPKLLNWDSAGQLRVVDAGSGAVLTEEDGAAAVIFAPGRPLAGQQRRAGTGICPGEQGNDYASYLESGSFPDSSTVTLRQGARDDLQINDRLVWITPRDIFTRVRARSDFAAQINLSLVQISERLQAAGLPQPDDTLAQGAKRVGAVPDEALADGTRYREWKEKWNDQLRYLVCTPAQDCLTVNGEHCAAAIVFAGERSGGGPRSALERTQLASYFEGENLTALGTPATTLAGAGAWDSAQPSADVALCLRAAAPPGARP